MNINLLVELRKPKVEGQKFGRLLVLEVVRVAGRWHLKCRCDCGKEVTATYLHVKRGNTSSCGCLHRDRTSASHIKHGGKRVIVPPDKEYCVWQGMIQRCNDQHHKSFPDYGGRGISVCPEWLNSYQTFLSDVGRRPAPGYTIERIDNNGNYEPGNVRWATRREQGSNKSNNRRLEWNGKTQAMSQWAREFGIPYDSLRARLRYGWSMEKALTTPVRSY